MAVMRSLPEQPGAVGDGTMRWINAACLHFSSYSDFAPY